MSRSSFVSRKASTEAAGKQLSGGVADGAEVVSSKDSCQLAMETIRSVLVTVGRTEDPSSNAAVLLLIDCLVSSKSVETISRAIAVHSAQLKEIGYDDVSGAATVADLAEVVEVALECLGACMSYSNATSIQDGSISGALSVALALFGDLCDAADRAAVSVPTGPIPATAADSAAPSHGKAMDVSETVEVGGEEEEESSPTNLQNLLTACAECLCEITTNASWQTVQSFGEELTQRLALSLCRGLSRAVDGVALPCSVAMGSLGSKEQYCLSSKLNGLLSNALLRSLGDSSAEASLLLHDSCFSSFIDLHSSDDPDLLSNFNRLGAIAKLKSALEAFEGRLKAPSAVSQEETSQFEETAETVRSFIEYKENYIKTTMH